MSIQTLYTKPYYNSEIPIDWNIKAIEEIIQNFRGGAPLAPEDFTNKGFRVLPKSGVCHGGILRIKIEEQQYCSYEYAEKHSSNTINNSFTIIVLRDLVPIGPNIGLMVKYYNIEDYILAQGVYAFKIKDKLIDENYLIQYSNGQIYRKLMQQLKVGSTQVHITNAEFLKVKIPIPPHPEQRAIAQVLSTADAAIHTNEKLIAQKELRKKWLMQQLLTGKKRLKGFENTKWKIQPLENFIKPIVREVPKPSSPYLGIGLRSHGKGTFLKHDEQPEKNSMDNFYVVRPNDLIVNITFAWEQAIAIVRPEDDGALASHRFPTYTFIEDKGHSDFFRFYILQPRMKFMLQMISPGGAGRNRVMSKSDFIKLEFLLPDYKEQTAIAQVLQTADKEISLLKAKAEKLREQKKGLMQVLLTGKVRLKIKNTI
jgi:type I restriction enzyme S subunit